MRLLLLEDDALGAKSLMRWLRLRGHQTHSAARVSDATTLLESNGPFDFALIDIGLKHGESGLDFLAHLRVHHPTMKKVVMSGGVKPHSLQLTEGVEVFCSKPLQLSVLERLLEFP